MACSDDTPSTGRQPVPDKRPAPPRSNPLRPLPLGSHSLRVALTALCDLFLPRTCLACGRILGAREQDLCLFCRSDLPLTHYWEASHNPMADRFNQLIQRDLEAPETEDGPVDGPADGLGNGLVEELVGEPADGHEPYAYAVALFHYRSGAGYHRIPQALKYSGNIRAGIRFGRLLGLKIAASPCLKDITAVIPVPLHWRRHARRGYNQAEILAREIAAVLNVRMLPHLLVRHRPTRSQTRLSREAKVANVSNAFRLRSYQFSSSQLRFSRLRSSRLPFFPPTTEPLQPHLLLVDDVFTTGATLHACYRVLRTAFPTARISVATLAVVGS